MEIFDTEVRAAYFALDQQGRDVVLAMMRSWAAAPIATPQPLEADRSQRVLTLVPRTNR